MLLVKQGENILIDIPFQYKELVKDHVRGCLFRTDLKKWMVPAGLSTYRNIKSLSLKLVNHDALEPATKLWVENSEKRAMRLDELQKGEAASLFLPDGFVNPVEPFKHQIEAALFSMNLDKCALWLDLGLGKTYTSILVARMRSFLGLVQSVLIVCPLSLIWQWESEILRFTPEGEASIYKMEGTKAKKLKVLKEYLDKEVPPTHVKYLIITYESLETFSEGLGTSVDMFILDESTKIKNPMAKRTGAAVRMCNKIPYGVELTGLAYTNNPEDLFSQFKALDPCVYGDDIWAFRGRYLETMFLPFSKTKGDKKVKVVTGYKNMTDLKTRAFYLAFSRMKDDCVDLPEKTYTMRDVYLNANQLEWYNKVIEMIEKSVYEEGGKTVKFSPVVIAKMARLQQLLSGFMYTDTGEQIWVGSDKYAELLDIIETTPGQFVIWARHKAVIKRIHEFLEENGVENEALNNEIKGEQKAEVIRRFRSNELRTVVCSLDSESKGLNLTSTGSVGTIYFENTFSVDQRWQSESRVHRIGMKGTAVYVDLVTKGTLEEGIIKAVKGKLEVSEYIARHGLASLLGKDDTVRKKPVRLKKVQNKKGQEKKAAEKLELKLLQEQVDDHFDSMALE